MLGTAATALASLASRNSAAEQAAEGQTAEGQTAKGPTPSGPTAKTLGPLKITRVRPIIVAPRPGSRFVVVKVETSEPGLYGLGCASFRQRPLAVKTAVEEYLAPFCQGRDADQIEDLWQVARLSSYWRNGSVLNNALSGVDQALWDIKGKRANMPVYQLLGGKCRFAVPCYGHAGGRTIEQVQDSVAQRMASGYRYIRIQLGGYGSPQLSSGADFQREEFGLPVESYMDSRPYLNAVPKMFEAVRGKFGDDIELLHDIHERLEPIEAVNLCKEVERYRPFFIEDPFAPEAIGYFRMLRQQTSVPLAMGELFNHPGEWVGLISERLIDFIRVHLSHVGGLSVARKIAALAEWFQVRTAWHGPDACPVGYAAALHLDLAVHNFGVQETLEFDPATQEIFPGAPTIKNGYAYVNEAPGLGVDLDETLAQKPVPSKSTGSWLPVRRKDGTAVTP
jgi:mannonate dehydratase